MRRTLTIFALLTVLAAILPVEPFWARLVCAGLAGSTIGWLVVTECAP